MKKDTIELENDQEREARMKKKQRRRLKARRFWDRLAGFIIMTVLVVYCLRGISFQSSPFGVPELAASALVLILQIIRKNMYLSIIAGTVCYMILIRVIH